MRNSFLHGAKGLILICGMTSIVLGCASAPSVHETFMGEGFQASLPNAGTRVVVWGNHSGAVTRTLRWLHDHRIVGVDPSWIEKELGDPGFAHRTRMDQKTQVLAAAQSIGAPLVLFAQVEKNQLGQKFDLMSFEYKRMKIFGVEIRGMNTETGDVVFGAKAWNSKPLVESDQMVQDLTTFALQKAWNDPDSLLSQHEEVAQQRPEQEPVSVVPSFLEETRPAEAAALTIESTTSEAIAPALSDDTLLSDEEPSWGLEIAGGALSLLYMPFKVGYAGLGGLMGGLAYVLTAGNKHVAQSIWDASIQGTYWLRAKHLQGEEPIQFKGEGSSADPGHQAQVNATISVGSGVE